MSILCLVMHDLCAYVLKLLSGFLGQGLAFLVNAGWHPAAIRRDVDF